MRRMPAMKRSGSRFCWAISSSACSQRPVISAEVISSGATAISFSPFSVASMALPRLEA